MKIEVKVIPAAKKNFLKQDAGVFKVYLTSPAVEGKANKALIEFLSEHYGVPRRRIEIIKGLKSRHKIININDIS